MTDVTLTPQAQETVDAARDALVRAREIAKNVTSPETEHEAAEALKAIKRKVKDLNDQRLQMTRPLDESKKKIMALFKTPIEALTECERRLKNGIANYQHKVEQERRQLEAQARERARKEQERLRKRAEAAAEKGQAEKAEVLEDQAEQVAAPTLAKREAPSGVSTRVVWEAEVTDKMALIKAVAAGHAPHTLLEPNMTVLNQQARALKDAMTYPGVKAKSKKSVAVRS